MVSVFFPFLLTSHGNPVARPLASRETGVGVGVGSELFSYGTVIIGELKATQSVLRETSLHQDQTMIVCRQ